MLNLDKRPVKIININPRAEMHGDETVAALDVKLAGIMLNAEELGSLLREPHAWAQLFNERSGKLTEPAFRAFGAIPLEFSFENCDVNLYLGLKLELVELPNAKIKNLSIKPLLGGATEIKLTVQCTPEIDAVAAPLINWIGRDADVEIDFGDVVKADEKQAQLPLGADADEDLAPPKKRGRKKSTRAGDALN